MIKELGFTRSNTKTGYKYASVELILPTELPSAVLNRVPLLTYPKYYASTLTNIIDTLVNIQLKNGYPLADVMPVYIHSLFWCVSKKFKDIFESKLHGYWWSTTNPELFIFLLDNVVDGLDNSKTDILYSSEERHVGMPWTYIYIENETFKDNVTDEYIFTIPECFGTIFCSDQFEYLFTKHQCSGLQVFKNLNFKRKNKQEFDPFRLKTYDSSGNCID